VTETTMNEASISESATGEAPEINAAVSPAPRKNQQRNIRLTIWVIVVFITTVMALFLNKITTPRVLSNMELRVNGTFVFDQPRIFKDFNLLNQHGEPFNLESLKGKWSLLFFGYTSCPDVCPSTLAVMRDMKSKMRSDEIAEQIQIALVTVDPARDTVEALKPYMNYFDPAFIGATGDFLEIKRLANQLNMAFVKVPLQRAALPDGGYLVDHSANIALINPMGHYHGFVKAPLDEARMRLTLASIISRFEMPEGE